MLKAVVHKLGRAYQARIVRSEYEAQKFTRFNERPIEWSFMLRAVGKCSPKTLLDVGPGDTAVPALLSYCGPVVTAIDNVRDFWKKGLVNRHWHIIDDDIQRTKLTVQFDMVTCISVLEHIKDYNAAMRNMLRLLKPGGHLVLCGPYNEKHYVEDSYRAPGADANLAKMPFIGRSYSRRELDGWLREGNAEVIEAEYWRAWTGDFWAQGTRVLPPEPSTRDANHSHACFLIRRR